MTEFSDRKLLQGRVVAVTGAGRGVGRAIALCCAAEGAHVLVNDFGGTSTGEGADTDLAQDLAAAINAAGGVAIANAANVADPDGGASIVEDALANFGRIDAVVNNAGIVRDAIFHKMDRTDWEQVVDVHLNGSFHVARAAAPHFKRQLGGAYVHMTSTSGLIGNFGQANYAAAKMGIVGLSTSIALDMARFNVRSNCVAPFAWSRLAATIPAATEDERRRVDRMKDMKAEQVAPLVAFLCSDAGSAVTGQIFAVRKNEIFLFSRPHIKRSAHRADGWTALTIAEDLLPMMRPSLEPLRRSSDVFSWDPV